MEPRDALYLSPLPFPVCLALSLSPFAVRLCDKKSEREGVGWGGGNPELRKGTACVCVCVCEWVGCPWRVLAPSQPHLTSLAVRLGVVVAAAAAMPMITDLRSLSLSLSLSSLPSGPILLVYPPFPRCFGGSRPHGAPPRWRWW